MYLCQEWPQTHAKKVLSIRSRKSSNDWPINDGENGDHPYNGYMERESHSFETRTLVP